MRRYIPERRSQCLKTQYSITGMFHYTKTNYLNERKTIINKYKTVSIDLKKITHANKKQHLNILLFMHLNFNKKIIIIYYTNLKKMYLF